MGDSTAPTGERARAQMVNMRAAILFEKVLTNSDANGSGRIVIPKTHAEAHFPSVDSQMGMVLPIYDTYGKKHNFRFRFWINNASRMYLLENTQDVLDKYHMQTHDVLLFGRTKEGVYAVCGRKGTRDDVISRKTGGKRPADSAATQATRKAATARAAQTPPEPSADIKLRIPRQRALKGATPKTPPTPEPVTYVYWASFSDALRVDGVFRAAPSVSGGRGVTLTANGSWLARLTIGGEAFAALFDRAEDAEAALLAAEQDEGIEDADAAAHAAAAVLADSAVGHDGGRRRRSYLEASA